MAPLLEDLKNLGEQLTEDLLPTTPQLRQVVGGIIHYLDTGTTEPPEVPAATAEQPAEQAAVQVTATTTGDSPAAAAQRQADQATAAAPAEDRLQAIEKNVESVVETVGSLAATVAKLVK